MDDKLKKKIERLISNTYVKTHERKKNYKCINKNRALRDTDVDGVVEINPQDWQLDNLHAETFLKLAQQLDENTVKEMDAILLGYITSSYKKQIIDAITLYFVHSGKLSLLIEQLNNTFTSYNDNGSFKASLLTIGIAMRHRPDIFDEATAEQLYDWSDSYTTGKTAVSKNMSEYPSLYSTERTLLRKINELANEILTNSFIKQIDQAFNPEINQDEETVKESMDELGLPIDLKESLKHVNQKLDSANTKFDYRDTMSALRAFTERLYEQVAKKIDGSSKIDGKDSEKAAKFFHESGLISGDISDLIKAHRHFLSNDGAHRLQSLKEDARIAKNMTIELALYLLTRLTDQNRKSKNG